MRYSKNNQDELVELLKNRPSNLSLEDIATESKIEQSQLLQFVHGGGLLKEEPYKRILATLGIDEEVVDLDDCQTVQPTSNQHKSEQNVQAITVWKERLGYFETHLARESDPSKKFTIEKEIQEAKKKIGELQESTVTSDHQSQSNSNSNSTE